MKTAAIRNPRTIALAAGAVAALLVFRRRATAQAPAADTIAVSSTPPELTTPIVGDVAPGASADTSWAQLTADRLSSIETITGTLAASVQAVSDQIAKQAATPAKAEVVQTPGGTVVIPSSGIPVVVPTVTVKEPAPTTQGASGQTPATVPGNAAAAAPKTSFTWSNRTYGAGDRAAFEADRKREGVTGAKLTDLYRNHPTVRSILGVAV